MIYIHIPFCRSFCNYCAFYSELSSKFTCEGGDVKIYKKYTDLICNEIVSRAEEIIDSARDNFVHTLYFGGGTPSLLPADCIEKICSHLSQIFPNRPYEEFTLEANPEDIVEKGAGYISDLKALGLNRISMGLQSFDNKILRWMHRRHRVETIYKAIDIIRSQGIENISVDLIFGFPLLSMPLWRESLEKAIALGVPHLSAYQLSIDDNSSLAIDFEKGRYQPLSQDVCAGQYELLCEYLGKAGYEHYEISNFAKKGYHAKHNAAYWTRQNYIGLGAAAHSLVARNIRKFNSSQALDYSLSEEHLTEEDIRIEEIMLALRTAKGLPKSKLYALCEAEKIDKLLTQSYLEEIDNLYIRIPESAFFISDSIISDLI